MSEAIDLTGVSVMIAMPVRSLRDICVPTTISLWTTADALRTYEVHHHLCINVGDIIDHARSRCVQTFLKSTCTHLFFCDSDLGWKPEDFVKLLAYAAKHYEVIGAAYRAKREAPFFLWNPGGDGRLESDARGCLPLNGNGLGFTCIRRTVLEQLTAKAPVRKHPPKGDVFPDVFRFDRVPPDDELRGEDFSFFADVRALGYTPYLDPSIELRHLGDKEYTGKVSDFLVKADPAEAA